MLGDKVACKYLVPQKAQNAFGSAMAASKACTAGLELEHWTGPTLPVGVGPEAGGVASTQLQTWETCIGITPLKGVLTLLGGYDNQKSQNLVGSVTSLSRFWIACEEEEQSVAARTAATKAEDRKTESFISTLGIAQTYSGRLGTKALYPTSRASLWYHAYSIE